MPTRRQVSALISVPVLIWSQYGLAPEPSGAFGGRFKGGRLGEGWAGWDIRKVNAQDWF